jgi:hypothetical protein
MESISIASWNINILPPIGNIFARNPEQRLEQCIDYISNNLQDCDILAFQEVFNLRLRDILRDSLVAS